MVDVDSPTKTQTNQFSSHSIASVANSL